jgi:hypothetical protein
MKVAAGLVHLTLLLAPRTVLSVQEERHQVVGSTGSPWWVLRLGSRRREVVVCAAGCPPPLAVGCRRLPQRRRWWIYAVVGLLMSLLADLWPLRWRLAARQRWRHVSGTAPVGSPYASALLPPWGVLVPGEGDL